MSVTPGFGMPTSTSIHVACLNCHQEEICFGVGLFQKCVRCKNYLRTLCGNYYYILHHEHGYDGHGLDDGLLRQYCPACNRVTWAVAVVNCDLGHTSVRMELAPTKIPRGTRVQESTSKCPVKRCWRQYGGEDESQLMQALCPDHPGFNLRIYQRRIILASGADYF